ncbi:MAG: Rieske 2Fe-2S domain-containing protein [bacterium]|nr:Rieske 2Fe-2S domain-containing protein [bacterium]
MTMNRRNFIQQGTAAISALAAGGCACGTMRQASAPPLNWYDTPGVEPQSLSVSEKRVTIDLDLSPVLSEAGSAVNVIDAERDVQIIVVRPSEHEFCALRRYCTHGAQVLCYNPSRKVLQCNGYNHSIFSLSGDVVKGPAPKPLQRYPVALNGSKLEIEL